MASDPNQDEREVTEAMRTIQFNRTRFSASVMAEAWRRLGGIEAVSDWKERTRPIPNAGPEATIVFDGAAMRRAMTAMGASAATTLRETVRDIPQMGCMCDYCVESRGGLPDSYDLGRDVATIVRSLQPCSPQAVTAALKILASGPNKRCAFCSAGPGDMHSTSCPFAPAIPVRGTTPSLLNPPVRGFAGAGSLPYDSDYD